MPPGLSLIDSAEPEDLAALFVRNQEVHARNTRTRAYFHPPRIRNEFGRRRFAYKAATLYNALYQSTCVRDGGAGERSEWPCDGTCSLLIDVINIILLSHVPHLHDWLCVCVCVGVWQGVNV